MRFIIRPGASPAQIKMVIAGLFGLYLALKFLLPEQQKIISTQFTQAEVISVSDDSGTQHNSVISRVLKVRLEDGSHAHVSWGIEKPGIGDSVPVQVRQLENGTRRVSLVE